MSTANLFVESGSSPPSVELRPYQQEILAAILKNYRKGVRRMVVASATGTGKTVMFSRIPSLMRADLPGQILVLVHTEELLNQNAEELQASNPDLFVSVEMAERHADPTADIIVASVPTLGRAQTKRRENFNWDNISICICDECFPAGTLIDGRPIETIKVGDEVSAFDEASESIVVGRVSRLFVNQTEELVRITAGQHQVVCTPNHPFYTKRGWINANQLDSKDEVYLLQAANFRTELDSDKFDALYGTNVLFAGVQESSIHAKDSESHQTSPSPNMHILRRYDTKAQFVSNGHDAAERQSLLLQKMRTRIHRENLCSNNGGDESQVCVCSDDCSQSNVESCNSSESVGNTASNRTQTADSDGERKRIDCPSEVVVEAVADGHRSCGADAPVSGLRVSAGIQVGHRRREPDAGNRSGWGQPRFAVSASGRSEEGKFSGWIGVDCVEVLESGCDGTFGGLCPDGRVYNFEVEGLHTYTANGFVVHNCHHSTSTTYRNIFEAGGFLTEGTHKLLAGFTATANRADGTPLKDIYEKIIFDYPLHRAIEEKYLCDVTGVRVNTQVDLDDVHTINGEFKLQELADAVNNPERNTLVVEAWKREASPRKTIVFAVNVQHAIDLAACFREHGVAAEAVWGEDAARAEKLARYKSGETLVLSNCQVLTEGWNSPSVSCICCARPTKSNLLFTQMVGRGTRLFEGKKDCLVLDVCDVTAKHSLTTLASLLGFPHDLQLRGMSAVKAIGIIEEAQKKYPHINLEELRDIDKLDEYIESVNLFDVQFAPEVLEHSTLSWFHTSEGYVLSLPHGNRALITTNLLGKFESIVSVDGQAYKHTGDTLADAFNRTDWFLRTKCANDIPLVAREQKKWHADLATPAQLTAIRKAYPGKAIPADLSKGNASKLISRAKASAPQEPATSKQLGFLRWKGIAAPANCTKAQAGALITEYHRGLR